MQLRGSFTALITPFRDDGIDEQALQRLIAWQIEEGTDGVIPCGTTGESPTLTHAEHRRVIDLTVEVAKGKAIVMAGAGSNSTAEAIALTQYAEKVGSDAVLVVCPYYNRPNQDGLYQHYKSIHDASEIPIIIYNIPGRTGVDMTVDTMRRLAELPRIVGVKDAAGDLARPLRTRQAIGPDFWQLSGDDITAVPFLAQGGHGCISVVSNVAPRLCAQMQHAWIDGDYRTTFEINNLLAPLADALFVEPNPVPVKYAASLLGKSSPDVRGPLVQPAAATRERVKDAMRHAGLID